MTNYYMVRYANPPYALASEKHFRTMEDAHVFAASLPDENLPATILVVKAVMEFK